MEIGAYCQCYKQPVALDYSLHFFRNAYPTGTVVLVSDNGCDFSNMAKKYNAHFFHEKTNTRMGWNKHEREGFIEFFDRLRKYVPLIKEEYFMFLEEDVHVINRVTEPLLGTGNANGYNTIEKEWLKTFKGFENLTENITSIVQGGSIWHKEKFLRLINNVELVNYLQDCFETREGSVFDFFISVLAWMMNEPIYKLRCHKELWTDQVRSLDGISILNQVKHFYTSDPVDMTIKY